MSSPLHLPHVHSILPLLPMSILRRLALRLNLNNRRSFTSVAAAAVRQDATLWSQAPLPRSNLLLSPSFTLHRRLSLSRPAISHTRPGQYLQLRIPDVAKPSFLAIASPPSYAAAKGAFEFLVKSVAGSTAELLCGLRKEMCPIRSLIESGFSADRRSDVRLYYGARNLKRMAYQDRFKDWNLLVLRLYQYYHSQKAAFSRAKKIDSPLAAGAVLCGRKQMAEEVTSILVADGVSSEKI
ncbi:hypothetical protein GH714_041149 [Hevea brasiliensis]|uniref:Uncharacterized protein n=1 Tax=Hevea brasiliensis TaxID=3981 RepID=A0A6A6MXG8_HEVBR|nr:hypothetical protein GH714_041149 [Hevea brasiliensis]